MRSPERGEHAMAEGAAVAAGARTGSSAALAKSPWCGIGRRRSWSSKNPTLADLTARMSGHRRAVPSHPLGNFEDEPAEGGEAEAPEKYDSHHRLPFLLFTGYLRA
jgi:hypothetical protein